MNTNILIFSKNRTLQLKSLLLSIRHFTDMDEKRITILYVQDDPEVDFTPLKEEFECRFYEQISFLQDVKNIIADFDGDYIQFMVDDLIFRDNINYAEIEKLLDSKPDIDAFQCRLGYNIKYGKEPDFRKMDNFLCWDTSPDIGKYWNYFWELTSGIYRRELVQEYLNRCRPNREFFPNPFEDHFYTCMPNSLPRPSPLVNFINAIRFCFKRKKHRIASYHDSKCFTMGVNLVADIDDNREQQFDTASLHKKMMEGYIIDFKCLKDALPEKPNAASSFFKLEKSCDL